ncbi:MAG: hypothetical protein R3A51_03750 [Nannocystaceae bacterium]
MGARINLSLWTRMVVIAAVVACGLALLWPAPAGVMPLSADHTVHLTRAWLLGQKIAGGQLSGWSSAWFFGTPLGELYPPLGDLVVCLVRGLSLGALSWAQSYALALCAVFVTQGLCLVRAARALGLGRWGAAVAGLCAALLALVDVGAYREGGWTYTITYGVWPQTLATSLTVLAFAELALAWRPASMTEETSDRRRRARGLTRAALATAAAALAHQMSLPMLAGGALLFVTIYGCTDDGARLRARLPRAALHAALGLGLGLSLAAFWVFPMLAHRGWMASYGWLYAPLEVMARQLITRGQWVHFMPAAVGYAALVGVALAIPTRRPFLRFAAAMAVSQWALASADAFWELRLDRLSAGFSHLQYQRFLIAAKPWIFLLAGAVLGCLVDVGVGRARVGGRARRVVGLALVTAALALAALLGRGAVAVARAQGVGVLQLDRLPGAPGLDEDYAALLEWARARRAESDRFYRIAFRAHRNLHWFMDSTVTTETPVYKLGFTPGDNFVHKPEAGSELLFDRLGVRYVVSTGRAGPGPKAAAQFGSIRVLEREAWRSGQGLDALAHLEGPGQLRLLAGGRDGAPIVLEVSGTGGPGGPVAAATTPRADDETWLVVHVAGYPRWEMTQAGAPLEWIEVPAAPPAQARPRPRPSTPAAAGAARRQGPRRRRQRAGPDGGARRRRDRRAPLPPLAPGRRARGAALDAGGALFGVGSLRATQRSRRSPPRGARAAGARAPATLGVRRGRGRGRGRPRGSLDRRARPRGDPRQRPRAGARDPDKPGPAQGRHAAAAGAHRRSRRGHLRARALGRHPGGDAHRLLRARR